jgi:hypothetical protein
MSTPINEVIDAIKGYEYRIDKGPWKNFYNAAVIYEHKYNNTSTPLTVTFNDASPTNIANLEFIILARNVIFQLCDEIDRLNHIINSKRPIKV